MPAAYVASGALQDQLAAYRWGISSCDFYLSCSNQFIQFRNNNDVRAYSERRALICCRQNLADAAQSDKTLRALVADNQAAFAAVGLGTLPGKADTLLVRKIHCQHVRQPLQFLVELSHV